MTLEELYKGVKPKDYFVGKVSQVYRSSSIVTVENNDLMADRKKFDLSFRPNTINYFVIIESALGLFLGEVFENKEFKNGSEDVHELCINTAAFMGAEDNRFVLSGFKTLGLGDNVYIATDDIYKLFVQSLELSVTDEKPLPTFATYIDRTEADVQLTPSTIFNRHVMCIGSTNSGKSTTGLAILDKLITSKKKALSSSAVGI